METQAATVIRETQDAALAGDWGLVLAAAGIAHDLQSTGGWFRVAVEANDRAAAGRALDAFDAEARADLAAPAPPIVADQPKSTLGLWTALLLVTVHLLAGGRDVPEPSRWFAVGSASADLILQGQWWRALTALTLHADLLHLFGNAVAALIFVSAVGRSLGPGVGAALILTAGAAGNLITAAVHRTGHVSVGASTATFAALGLMAGLGVLRRYRQLPQRRRAWLPIGAGLGLFAMLGVGEHSDVLAHLFGLGAGCLLGIATAIAIPRRMGPVGQTVLAIATLAALAGSWWLALHR
jgi:rhomboid protease GluP